MVLILSVVITLGLTSLSFGWNYEYVADNYSVGYAQIDDNNQPYFYTTYDYKTSYSTHVGEIGNKDFSGVLEDWDETPGGWVDPSTHKALCNTGWNSFVYYNGSGSTAAGNLNGNCMFTFYGHSNRYNIQLNSGSSFIAMSPTYSGGATGDVGYVSSCNNLDDMAFALLHGCYTSYSSGTNSSITWYMRCIKGVDTVVGFNGFTYWRASNIFNGAYRVYYPSHVWNEMFWDFTQRCHWNVGNSEGGADYWVNQFCNGYWGLETSETWGNASQYIYTPHSGTIEL